MKIGIIQCNPVTADFLGNSEKIFNFVSKAAEDSVDLCVAPELVFCGPLSGDLLLRPSFLALAKKELEDLSYRLSEANLPPLLLGAPVANPIPHGKPLQNCAVLLEEGKVSVVGRKVLLPYLNELNDSRYFEPGAACGFFNFKGWRLVVTIGEDAWNNGYFWHEKRDFFCDPLKEFMEAGGADCIINLSAIPYASGTLSTHQRLMGWLASHYKVPVLGANIVGGNDGLVYYGGSFSFNREGHLTARAPLFEEASLVVNLSEDQPAIAGKEPQTDEELWKAMVLGTRDFANKCGISKAIIGLSGGIDSSLVACVGVEALGADRVTGVLMPSPYSSEGSVADAKALAKKLGIKVYTLPLHGALEAYQHIFANVFENGLCGVTEENIQARTRGAMLMAFANEYHAMVLNTGNKSEAAVGYSTLYGDQVGALCVIGDLYKMQVYSVCKWLNETKDNIIPEAILTKAPSAELSPGQKDSDSLPAYEILDGILDEIIEKRKGLEEIVYAGFDEQTVRNVFSLIKKSQFKRKQSPPTLQLSTSPFATKWHMPIAGKSYL